MKKIFKIVLSSGDPIQIYEEEIEGVVLAIHRGDKIVVTKRGIFNPSFYVEIVLDKKWMDEQGERAKYGKQLILPEDINLEGLKRLGEMKQKTLTPKVEKIN